MCLPLIDVKKVWEAGVTDEQSAYLLASYYRRLNGLRKYEARGVRIVRA